MMVGEKGPEIVRLPLIGYVGQTLLGDKVFSVRFVKLNKRGLRAWLAMQLVGGAVTLAGDLHVQPGDVTEAGA